MNPLMMMLELVPKDFLDKYLNENMFLLTDTVTDVITTSTTVTGVSVLIGSLFFFPRPVRVFLFKTISSCFSIGISISFLPRRLLRIEIGFCSSSFSSGVGIVSTGDVFLDFVLRLPRRFGDGS